MVKIAKSLKTLATNSDESHVYSLASRMKHLRELRQLSQSDLAKKSGVSQATIAHIEKGRKDPSVGTLRKIAEALDVAIAIFFTGPNIHVFDLIRMKKKYTKVTELNDTVYRSIDQVIRYAKEIGFL